jgi:hypothetical protein
MTLNACGISISRMGDLITFGNDIPAAPVPPPLPPPLPPPPVPPTANPAVFLPTKRRGVGEAAPAPSVEVPAPKRRKDRGEVAVVSNRRRCDEAGCLKIARGSTGK